MPEPKQTYANHTKLVPIFHYVAFPILAANFFRGLWALYQQPSVDTVFAVLLGFAFIIMFFAARVFALKAQDRVIRLEMRLRMKEVLPASMHPRIKDFTPGQLVALRFASDAELPGLAETVLRDNILDRKKIKLMVKDWQGDYLRV